jgi:MOSC domain-containing protein YiiM
MENDLATLMARFAQAGRLQWIGVRPQRRAGVVAIEAVKALADRGLEGDHYAYPGGKRQVTLIQAEHLGVVAKLIGKEAVKPEWLRRNLVVAGINLYALRDRRFRIGAVVLEGTGPCEPCSRMEEALGSGGYNAMRGHGGITARVLEEGTLRVGEAVHPL